MNTHTSLLSGQNLWLRLLILVLALIGALDATLRQLLGLIVLFLLFLLLDLSAYPKILKALRISLPFFAAYWVFATLFSTPFQAMVLFTLKLLLFIVVTAYVFGDLTLNRVLRDTRALRRYSWGEQAVRYLLATGLFIRAYTKYFTRRGSRNGNSIGSLLDRMIEAGRYVAENSSVTEAQLRKALQTPDDPERGSCSSLISLSLITCLILVLAL